MKGVNSTGVNSMVSIMSAVVLASTVIKICWTFLELIRCLIAGNIDLDVYHITSIFMY